jgi:hypothetical protein
VILLTFIIRQGDVGLIPIEGEPPHELRQQKTRLIRKGEHGGKHELATLERASIWEAVLPDGSTLGTRFIQVVEPTEVVHHEHNSVALSPQEEKLPGHIGWYEIRIQREEFASRTVFVGD